MRRPARTDLLAAMRCPALPALAATIGLALGLAAPAGAASFAPGPCPAPETPIPALANARCGILTVPENRSRPDGRTIRLRVAIVPAQSPAPAPDPVVYLTGGPGGSAISALQNVVNAGANRDRDLIVLEQRGTLYSDPSLTCPVIDRWNSLVVSLPYDARSTGRKQTAATRACRQSVVAKGADPGSYNTTESTADFAELRVALGIPEWNVIGASYGTDLALSYMRDHPEGIRSVTIDSVIAPDQAAVSLAWTSAGVGMRQMFQACRAQPRCRRAYPRPGRVFTRLVRRLEARPITAFVKPALIPGDKPEPGAKRVKVVLDGGAFANYVINITGAGFGAKVPKLLYDFAHGRRKPVLASQAATGELHAGELSYGLQYGVICSEWIPFETERDVLRRGRQAFPGFPRAVRAQPPQFPFRFMDCPVWDVPKAPDSQRAVARSAIPTLVLAGSFDTLTSEANARYAASNLPNARLVVIPGAGHVVLNTSKCAGSVFASFLNTPASPDTRCTAALRPPPFEIG
jgi:pimeloyl-ACP methyl ester carboxylesterase